MTRFNVVAVVLLILVAAAGLGGCYPKRVRLLFLPPGPDRAGVQVKKALYRMPSSLASRRDFCAAGGCRS